MQLVYPTVYLEVGGRSKQVQSFTVRMQMHSHVKDRILGKQLVNIQVIDHQIGQISIRGLIVASIETGSPLHLELIGNGQSIVMHSQTGTVHQSYRLGLRLLQQQVGRHFGTGQGKASFKCRTTRYRHLSVGHSWQKTHIESLCLQAEFTTSTDRIGQMQQVTPSLQSKSTGQIGRKVFQVQTVQVAFRPNTHLQRLGRISLHKIGIHCADHFYDVFLAKLCYHRRSQQTGLLHVQHLPAYLCLHIKRRSGGIHH